MNASQVMPEDVAKQQLTYSVYGLPAREILLLKSMVRLLSHRTTHNWVYSMQSAQLRVVSETIKAAEAATHGRAAQQLLTLGTLNTADHQRQGYLCLPLRAHELELELNKLGPVINTTLRARQAAAMEVEHIGQADSMRMLRWPPPTLLQAPGRLKLATLMTGRPMTLTTLHQYSGQTVVACKNFLNDLHNAHLLQIENAAIAAIHAAPAQLVRRPSSTAPTPGLFARIRMRLGLQTLGGSESARSA